MNNLLHEQYHVAWQKLIECMQTGQYARATGVYSLLSRSFRDQAQAYQLEGDVRLISDDHTGAIELYEKAARAYCAQHEYEHAILIYSRLCALRCEDRYLTAIKEIYVAMPSASRSFEILKYLCCILLRNNEFDRMQKWLDECTVFREQLIELEIELTYQALIENRLSHVVKNKLLMYVLGRVKSDISLLRRFLTDIKSIHVDWYMQACDYLQDVRN